MSFEIELKCCGTVLVSELFTELVDADSRFTEVKGRDVQSLDKIQREIAAGKKIVLADVKTADADKLYRYIEKRSAEAVGFDKKKQILNKNYDRDRKKSLVSAEIQLKSSIFILADLDQVISLAEPGAATLCLFGLCGNDYPLQQSGENTHRYHLLPYKFYLDLLVKYQERQPVEVLSKNLFAGPNVLIPKSPETYQLFVESIEHIQELLPDDCTILDLGCGSGVLSLIFAQCLTENKNTGKIRISLTDILPEALATARFNLTESLNLDFKISDNCWQAENENAIFSLMPHGHLFNKINQRFDLISFNAPWVPGKPRNRSELALHDDEQKITREFLTDAHSYLNHNGRILLGYSDNGGEEYLAELEDFITAHGWVIDKTVSKRVQSYQSGRKWQKILVYVLRKR